ncbi:MAG: hypothetical protein WCA46_04355 [Actinocatenispora sp.]
MTEQEFPAYERSLLLADDAELAALAGHADQRGWQRVVDQPGGFYRMAKVAWDAPDDLQVLYSEDSSLGARFVSVCGPQDGPVAAVLAELADVLPVVGEDELLSELIADPRPEPQDTIDALHQLMALHSIRLWQGRREAPDDRYRRVADLLARHPHRMVRLALLMVTGDLARVRSEMVAPILAHADEERDLADQVDVFRKVVAEIPGA